MQLNKAGRASTTCRRRLLSSAWGHLCGVRPHGWSPPAQLLLPHLPPVLREGEVMVLHVFTSGDDKALLDGKALG